VQQVVDRVDVDPLELGRVAPAGLVVLAEVGGMDDGVQPVQLVGKLPVSVISPSTICSS